MSDRYPSFASLRGDEVYAEGLLASDAASMQRRLERLEPVCKVNALLKADPLLEHDLVSFVENLLAEDHDPEFRHTDDIAVCAALTLLGGSRLPRAQRLIRQLAAARDPSLCWIAWMAQYCDESVESRLGGSEPASDLAGHDRAAAGVLSYAPTKLDLGSGSLSEYRVGGKIYTTSTGSDLRYLPSEAVNAPTALTESERPLGTRSQETGS